MKSAKYGMRGGAICAKLAHGAAGGTRALASLSLLALKIPTYVPPVAWIDQYYYGIQEIVTQQGKYLLNLLYILLNGIKQMIVPLHVVRETEVFLSMI